MSVVTYDAGPRAAPAEPWCATNGETLTIRRIRPDDAAIEQAFVRGLSLQSRQQRFMQTLRELSGPQLARFTQIDPAREEALIALQRAADGAERQVAVARFVTGPDGRSAEFALVIADVWQRRGLGRHLLTRLIGEARRRGLREMVGEVLADNGAMLGLARSLGFAVEPVGDDAGVRRVVLQLDAGSS